ncbi:DUF1194 domain-containing protein [Hwanghaeella sp.]|uniref:DUF1194 domain-containing protein n=1 Tax=Hwanghaeella sp. TaxID=2605943 RepID=UPI003CCC02DE
MSDRQSIVSPILALAAMLTIIPFWTVKAQAQEKVDLELVIAADGSGSIDDEELALQRRGYANAVTDPTLLSLMTGGLYGKTAILYVEWGAADSVHTIVDWTIIGSKEDAAAFADRLQNAPRKAFGYNAISAAIDYAVIQFATNGIDGLRRIIDVSGDGPNINARPVTMARDDAVAQGITINALVVKTRGGGYRGPGGMPLEEHYKQHVIGGPGAFVRIADKDTSFAEAVRNKMLLEVARGIPQTAEGPQDENRIIID